MKSKSVWLVLAVLAVIALGGWLRHRQAASAANPEVAIQDGKTLDFSSGRPVVKDSPAEKKIIDSAVKEMDDAAKNVAFAPLVAPKPDAKNTRAATDSAPKK